MSTRKIAFTLIFLLAAAIAGTNAYLIKTAGDLSAKTAEVEKSANEKILILHKQIAALEEAVREATGENARVALSLSEIEKRQELREKSQDELLTEAVAKVAPAVVSIVISKDVQKLEVVFQNPFGDDPFFKDFDIKIPVYRQRGVEHRQVGSGTGFLITSDGYIVTNRHIVNDEKATYTVLLSDGGQKNASVVYRDPNNDAAVLKISGGPYPVAKFGNSSGVKLGQTVIAIGNALGQYNNSVSVGIISGLNRSIEAAGGGVVEKLTNVIQTDAAINPGNSGGPLFTTGGEVIGINVATVIGSNSISFAIPANTIKKSLQQALGISL